MCSQLPRANALGDFLILNPNLRTSDILRLG